MGTLPREPLDPAGRKAAPCLAALSPAWPRPSPRSWPLSSFCQPLPRMPRTPGPHDRRRVRRNGSEAHRGLDGRGLPAELRQAQAAGALSAPADHQSGPVAGGLVVLRHRAEPRGARHLRLPEPRSADLRAGLFHRFGHPGQAVPDVRAADSTGFRLDHQPSGRHARSGSAPSAMAIRPRCCACR